MKTIRLGDQHPVRFKEKTDLKFNRRERLPHHPNGMHFEARDGEDRVLLEREYYSVGGGFVVNLDEAAKDRIVKDSTDLPYPFSTGDELLAICEQHDVRISEVMMANEKTWRSEDDIRAGLLDIWAAMEGCMERGFRQEGVLPGGLKVQRRAPGLHRALSSQATDDDTLSTLDWVNLFALAVNEENAAGGRVVTAPTNGAAGIIPAVIQYYRRFYSGADDDGVIEFPANGRRDRHPVHGQCLNLGC